MTLADLFGIATGAAGKCETRDGVDLLGVLRGQSAPRRELLGMAEIPGSDLFKVMVVTDEWKYIFMANGGREQLFNLVRDPEERSNRVCEALEELEELRRIAAAGCSVAGAKDALERGKLRAFTYRERPRRRIYQFDRSRGVSGFPAHPRDVIYQPNGDQEVESLGLGLKTGESHYRAYIGPARDYDLIGAMSFNLLTTLGLRQHHRVVDIGCGSLRLGRLLIPYLNWEKYFGIEPNEWLIREGIRHEVGQSLRLIKRPHFYYTADPRILEELNLDFDFAVAQSIFSHCGLDLITSWLSAVARSLAPAGALVATFLPGEQDDESAGWIYPACVSYKPNTIAQIAADVGLRFQVLDWRHPRQTWALFAADQFDASWFETNPLTWNTMLASLLNR